MRIMVLMVAIITGLPVFIGGAFLFPDVQLVLNKDPNASIKAMLALCEIISFMVLVSVTCSVLAAKLLRVPGFEPGMARAWSTIASVPVIFIGPIAVIVFCIDKDWFHASICAISTLVSAITVFALNRILLAGSRANPPANI